MRLRLDFHKLNKKDFVPTKIALAGLLIITLYALVVACQLLIPPFLSAKTKFMDLFFKPRLAFNAHYRPDYPKESAVVMIAVDDESLLRTEGDIVSHPVFMAGTIEGISKCKPKIIVVDIAPVFNPKNPHAQRGVLIETIKKTGNVLMAYLVKDTGPMIMDDEIIKACMDYGRADVMANSGNDAVRTVIPPTFEPEWSIQKMPLPITAALIYRDMQTKTFALNKSARTMYFFSKEDSIKVPLNMHNQIPINYLYTMDQMPVIPAWKFLKGDFKTDLLQGKIALLTSTSQARPDQHNSPIGRVPGGLIFANIINSFVYSYFLIETPTRVHFAILFVASVILGLLFYKNTVGNGALILFAAIVIYVATSFVLLLYNVMWNAFDVIVLAIILYESILIHKARIWELENKLYKGKED
ncbi:MAG: CHASE2 domain-containing protein [Candidatus Omnitrophica bacterium]|nr:CHASE2 domain-containing protein [Candidatus Omnitrophota bacterium]